MTINKLLEFQTQRGAKTISGDNIIRTIESVTSECRRAIEDNSDKYRDLNTEQKKEAIKQIIFDYIMKTKPLVEGYINEDNTPDTNKLSDRLIEDITDRGILTAALLDEKIYEIRCNGKEIKVEKEGKVQDLRDKDGNIVSFESPEQQEIILRKLLGDSVRLTPKDAIVNSRTIEGYRIAAVHSSAISPDPSNPTENRYHAFVLRKFKKSKMNLSDIVKLRTISDGMAKLLSLTTAGGLTFITCGPTASGKTTTNNAILQSIPASTRVVLLQNPSEIDLRFKDSSGRIYNDALHLEATEKERPTATDATMSNLMSHTLRLSPTLVCFGELRTNKEFMLGMSILQAGHPVNATYHAEDSMGAIERFVTAYKAESGEDTETAISTLTRLLNIIIVQKIMKDGTRKVLQITEVLGQDPVNPKKPLLNDLYRFEVTDEPEYDDAGNIVKINGIHRRVHAISEKMIGRLKLEGVKTSSFEFLAEEPMDGEIETYTGNF